MDNSFPDKLLKIDGSYGEGGGQILRTALALSCLCGRPVEIMNIRKARTKPGLQPQHLTAVKAAAAISGARAEGAELSSTALRFSPGDVTGGDYLFDVAEKRGSAGSTSLVLQTVLLPLLFAKRPSRITVFGGTHVPWSPPYHYLEQVFLPVLSRMGAAAIPQIGQWGWYPLGGGRVNIDVRGNAQLTPFHCIERGKLVRVRGISAVSNLPRDIALRQRSRALSVLKQRGFDADIEVLSAPSPGKGTLVFLVAEFEHITVAFDALGAMGKRAETVADEACGSFFEYLASDSALDPHLADQLIPFLALADGASVITTSRITGHLLTNISVVQQFLERVVLVEGTEGGPGRLRVSGHSRP